jgi:hypothetical protein
LGSSILFAKYGAFLFTESGAVVIADYTTTPEPKTSQPAQLSSPTR